MATRRFSYLDDIVLKTGNIGINTSSPTSTVQFVGTCISDNLIVTSGVTTSTSFDGFLNTNKNIQSTTIDSGTSSSLSGEIVVGVANTLTIDTDAISGQGSVDSMKVSNTFNPPIGGTNDRPSAPKPGSLYYNKDFRTIEYWDGNFWRQVDNRTASGRGVFGGGSTPSRIKNIDYITIASQGNATAFGELTVGRSDCSACSSEIRGIWTGGFDDSTPVYNNEIDYVTLASEGNAIDFGNLSIPRQPPTSFSSSTRGINVGGYAVTPHVPSNQYCNVIDYVELATIGNAADFGDLITGRGGAGSFSSSTRGVIGGGITPVMQTDAEFVTIASKGNAVRFGELTAGVRYGGASNSTRGIFTSAGAAPGYNGVAYQYITIATEGNAEHFGDMISEIKGAGTSNQTRAVFGGGSSPARLNTLEYLTIATTGNASDFGEMTIARSDWDGACSDSHGGLGGF